MFRVLILFISLLAVLAVPALATFTVKVTAPEEMFAGDNTTIFVSVNNSGAEKFFTVSSVIAPPPANTWVSAEGPTAIRIPSGSIGTFSFILKPSTDARPNMYNFLTSVAEQGVEESVKAEWSTTVRQRVTVVLIRGVNLSCSSCTGDSLEFAAVIENIGTAPARNLKLMMSGPGQQIPLEVDEIAVETSKRFTGKLNLAGIQPADYTVKAELMNGADILDVRTVGFKVPLVKKVDIQRIETGTLWSRTIKLTAINAGNAADQARITASISNTPLASISFTREPDSRSGSEVVWTALLQPGVSTSVSYTEFYWPVPIIIVVAVLLAIYAYLWSTALVLVKHVTKREGEWTVSLTIINRGPAADGVVVRDVVPPSLELGGRFETLKPIVRKTSAGTELVWRVGGIRKSEQKVLHYRIVGERSAALPQARLSAKRGEKTLLASSASVEIPGVPVQPKLKVDVEK